MHHTKLKWDIDLALLQQNNSYQLHTQSTSYLSLSLSFRTVRNFKLLLVQCFLRTWFVNWRVNFYQLTSAAPAPICKASSQFLPCILSFLLLFPILSCLELAYFLFSQVQLLERWLFSPLNQYLPYTEMIKWHHCSSQRNRYFLLGKKENNSPKLFYKIILCLQGRTQYYKRIFCHLSHVILWVS